MSAREDRARPAAKTEPRRIRVNVPLADESVLAWFEIQENHSQSVRQLIRESIARDGYLDVVNRPVAQLPKRGRPPGQGGEVPQPGAYTERASAAADESADTGDLVPDEQDGSGPELLGIALQVPALGGVTAQPETQPAVPELKPEPAPAPAGQVDVNDIFSALRS